MIKRLKTLLSVDNFMPHGHCFLWRSDILLLNVGADIVIAFAYYAIPIFLIYFVHKRKDLAFNWIFVMFALFIIACGTTHIMEVLTIWYPFYGVQGLVKLFTAGISLVTAIALWPLMPKAIKIPSPGDLAAKNRELQALNEELIKASSSRLHQVIEGAPNGILMVDQSGNITLCNAEIEKLFGYARKELLGKGIEILVPERFRTSHPGHRLGYFTKPETRQMGAGRDLTGLRKDGTEFPVEIGVNPVQTPEGNFVLASIVDITERKSIEQKLHEAIAARDEFMSIASHELKTPLTSLSLQIQVMKQKINPETDTAPSLEKIAKVFDVSGKQVTRLSGLIEDLLDASRIQAGKFSFNFEEANLSEIVKEMVSRFTDDFTKAKMSYTADIDENIFGKFDHLRIEQVVDNLLSNAIKYAPQRPVKISLKKHKNIAKLIIEDHGEGIPPDRQEKIFDRFERVMTSNNVSGLGLGLFIVREIVQGHSGSVYLESVLGQGCKFIVDLPLSGKKINAQNPLMKGDTHRG